MSNVTLTLIIIISYLVGSFNSAIIVSWAMNLPDPRQDGSKNPGASNVLRLSGKLPAALTLFGDMLKAILTVSYAIFLNPSEVFVSSVFLFTVLGHVYPIFYKFKGGKGVATALGGLLVLSWQLFFVTIGVWLILVGLFQIISIASISSFVILPFAAYLFDEQKYVLGMVLVAALILVRHSTNIERLIKGKEPKIGKKNKESQ